MRVSIVTLVCCAAVAIASADLTVEAEAELPHVEGPAEFQVHRSQLVHHSRTGVAQKVGSCPAHRELLRFRVWEGRSFGRRKSH